MTERESYPIVRYEQPPVSNEDVLSYLIFRNRRLHFDELPPQLDFSVFEGVHKELYENYEDVPEVPDADSHIAALTEQYALLSTLEGRTLLEELKTIYYQKAAGERSTIIFFDRETGYLKRTPLSFGDITSTSNDYNMVIREKGIPVINIHTHPKNAFFSIQDFSSMLTPAFSDEMPYDYASTVLCPDYQILAIATAETPVMELTEFEKLRDEYRISPEEQKRMDELRKRKAKVEGMLAAFNSNSEQNLQDYQRTLLEEVGNQPDILQVRIQQWALKCRDFFDNDFSPRFNRAYSKASQQSDDYAAQVYNGNAVAFARAMNLKLYMATDGAHFREFSA